MSGFEVPSYAYDYFPLKLYTVGLPEVDAIHADLSGLDQTTAFYTPFSGIEGFYPTFPTYPVNTTPTVDRTGDDYYFTVNTDGTFSQTAISSASTFTTPLSFSFSGSSNGIATSTTPTSAPDSPTTWSDYLQSLQYSDINRTTLLAEPTFKIPGVGLGLLATTDGMGHVSNVQIDMSYQGLTRWNMNVLNPIYNMMDRESILLRASMTGTTGPNAGDNELRVGKAQDSNNLGITSLLPTSVSAAGLGSAGVGSNPILNRLASLQPRNLGLLIAGFNAQLDVQGSRQLAANQARFNVSPSIEFHQNLQQLTQTYVATQPQTEPKTPLAQELAIITQQQYARQLDGRVPLVAVLPGNNPLPSATSASAADVRPSMATEDALSKKGSAPNPFLWFGANLFMAQHESIPLFQQQQPPQQFFTDSGTGSGTSAGGGSGYSQGGSQNPFSGGFTGSFGSGSGQEGQPQLFRPRQPVSYFA